MPSAPSSPSSVFSDEPDVEVSRTTGILTTVNQAASPLLEIVLDPTPETTLTGVVSPPSLSSSPSPTVFVEVVTEAVEPVVDLVLEESAVVDISALGMQGDTGPAGPPGPRGEAGSGVGVNFVFDVPTTMWSCQHMLGRRLVDVVTVDINNDEIIGDIDYVSDDLVNIYWYYSTAGRACIST